MRELMPELEDAGRVLINLHEFAGELEAAARLIAQLPVPPGKPDASALLRGYAEGGAEGYWRARLSLLDQGVGVTSPVIQYSYAVVHLHLGEIEPAIDRLEEIVAAHVPSAVFIPSDQWFARLRGYPRFDALMDRIGTPPLPVN